MNSRRVAAFAAGFALLAGCSSSGPSTGDAPSDAGSSAGRSIPSDVLARRAIAYSGYRANQNPQAARYPTEDQIREDLQLLARGHWTFLRLFDCSPHAATVLKVIRDDHLDMRVMLGVWIAGAKAQHDAENRVQIDACVGLADQYGDVIAAVSVGNETLDDWSSVRVPPVELVDYIGQVRGRVTQPVTTDDMYIPFMFGQNGATSYADVVDVAQAVDFLSIHAYAFIDAPWSWDWKQLGVPEGHGRAVAMMNAAMSYTKAAIRNVETAVRAKGLDRPIVIGEAGWKSKNGNLADKNANFRAHPVNEKMFYDALMSWIYGPDKDATSPPTVFYFEAFDEPWKSEDDNWGLFDVDRKPKYVLWDTFADLKPAGAPDYVADDAVYYEAAPADAGSDAPADAIETGTYDAPSQTGDAAPDVRSGD